MSFFIINFLIQKELAKFVQLLKNSTIKLTNLYSSIRYGNEYL